MWIKTWWGTALLAVLLFLNLLLFVSNERAWIGLLSSLPQPVATLLAGIVGLGTIAWQTRTGFNNLIRFQQHQAGLADAQKESEAFREKKLLAAALHGELLALLPRVHSTQEVLLYSRKLYEMLTNNAGDKNVTFRFLQFSTVVYETHVSKLGLLGPSVAGDVISVYSVLGTKFDPPTMEGPPQGALLIVEGLQGMFQELSGEIVHVGARLSAIQFSINDPGSLLDFRKKRDAQKKATN